MFFRVLTLALGLGTALAATPATASVTFSGSLFNTNPPAAAGGRCSPSALTVSISPSLGSSVGSSNFGAFSAVMSHCINPPLPTSYSNGQFAFDFGAGNTLLGTYDGTLSATSTAGVFANLENYLVTGGTGEFLGAMGALTGFGTVTFASNAPPASTQTITGTISAVPEPSSWVLMLIGFGGLGYALRRRRDLQLATPYAVSRVSCRAT